MALTATQQAQILFKQAEGKGSSDQLRQYYEEPFKSSPVVLPTQVWNQASLIPNTAPTLSSGSSSGVVTYYAAQQLTAIAGTFSAGNGSFQLSIFQNTIPFFYGDGTSYNYTLTDYLGNPIAFGTNDWVFDGVSGTLTFYNGLPANVSQANPPKFTAYTYTGTFGVGSGSGGGGGNLNSNPNGSAGVSDWSSTNGQVPIYASVPGVSFLPATGSYNLPDYTGFVAQTTGTLPSPMVAGTTYYAHTNGTNIQSFYYTPGGTLLTAGNNGTGSATNYGVPNYAGSTNTSYVEPSQSGFTIAVKSPTGTGFTISKAASSTFGFNLSKTGVVLTSPWDLAHPLLISLDYDSTVANTLVSGSVTFWLQEISSGLSVQLTNMSMQANTRATTYHQIAYPLNYFTTTTFRLLMRWNTTSTAAQSVNIGNVSYQSVYTQAALGQALNQVTKNYLNAITTSNGTNIGNGNFELGTTTGWSLGLTGTLTNGIPTGTPTFGSGAAGALSISAISSGALAGAYSLSYASSAATTAGNMLASSPFYIDNSDQAKVLTFKMYYQVPVGASTANFSGTSSNSFGVALYDVTNSVWLSSTANFGMTQSSGTGYVTGTVQTGSTTTQMCFVLYNANATTGAVTLYVDDISVGPQTVPIGAIITDWSSSQYSVTPNNFGTVTGLVCESRWVGGELFFRGSFTAGTTVAATGSISLPAGLSIDSTRISSSSAGTRVGELNDSVSSTTTLAFGNAVYPIFYDGSTTGSVFFAYQASSSGFVKANANSAANSGALVTFNFSVPILGRSANVQMSSDTDTRVIAANAYLNTTTSYSHPIIFNSIVYDTSGSYSTATGLYTVPVSGYYKIYGTATSSGTPGIFVYKNGTAISVAGAVPVAGNPAAFAASTLCVAGDQLSIGNTNSTPWMGAALGSNNTSVTFERLSGPSVIAATETISASYYCSGNQAGGTSAQWNFDTKEYDDHGAVTTGSGWKFTAPVSGLYTITGLAPATAAVGFQVIVYKNGTAYKTIGFTSSTVNVADFTGDLRLNAGDYISLFPSATVTLSGGSLSGLIGHVEIKRVGN